MHCRVKVVEILFLVVTCSLSEKICLCNDSEYSIEPVLNLPAPPDKAITAYTDLGYSEDGRFLLLRYQTTQSRDQLCVWETAKWDQVLSIVCSQSNGNIRGGRRAWFSSDSASLSFIDDYSIKTINLHDASKQQLTRSTGFSKPSDKQNIRLLYQTSDCFWVSNSDSRGLEVIKVTKSKNESIRLSLGLLEGFQMITDNTMILSPSDQQKAIALTDFASKPSFILNSHDAAIVTITYNSSLDKLVLGSTDGKVSVWKRTEKTFAKLDEYHIHRRTISSLDQTKDGCFLAITSLDPDQHLNCVIVNLDSKQILPLTINRSGTYKSVWHPMKPQLAVIDSDHRLKIVHINTKKK